MSTKQSTVRNAALLLAGAVALSMAAHPAAAKKPTVVLAQSTFDADDEGWVTIGDSLPIQFNQTGGHPGGYVNGQDQSLGETWYFRAPAKFLGTRSTAYGQTLTYDLIASAIPDDRNSADVILRSGSLTLLYYGVHLPSTGWSHFSVPLKPGKNWIVGDTRRKASAKQFKQVLANLQEMDIRGEYITGPDTEGLDNVVLNGRG